MEKNYFTKGKPVIYHYKEWSRVYWNDSGWGYVDKWKRAILLTNPRDEEGKFTNDFRYEWRVSVKLKDEDGKIFTASLEDVEPDVDPSELSYDDLLKLWSEISHGSMYYSDYRNSLGVFENTAYDYYEGFCECVYYDLKDSLGREPTEEEISKFENDHDFAEYCMGVEYLRPNIAA